MNPLQQLHAFGQSVWIDYLKRDFIAKGELAAMIANDGVRGMTSNPSIFEKALAGKEYDADIAAMVGEGLGVGEIFHRLSIADIRAAADAFAALYEESNAADGYVSIEVSPYLARDAEGTIAEARDLWHAIERPNLMVKVPGTKEGVPAIEALIGDGININVTLLFARAAYQAVAEAYIKGLEARPAGSDLSHIASVASFFISRIDSKIDAELDELLKDPPGGMAAPLQALKGKAAIANARLAYAHYKKTFSGPRWEKLAARGARPQRLLWASTSTKNMAYSDVLYVEELIGPDTVNTMPMETVAAYRDHGKPAARLDQSVKDAEAVLADLKDAGVSLDAATDFLVKDGVAKFAESADALYGALAAKRRKLLDGMLTLAIKLPEAEKKKLDAEMAAWTAKGNVRRIWARDASLWTGKDEARWLGWLDIAARERADIGKLEAFAARVNKAGFTTVVLCGMGGSSLGAEVLAKCFGHRTGWPEFCVLDSTDPAELAGLARRIELDRALFIICSKSGSTIEPTLFKDYFFAELTRRMSPPEAARRFVAITDPVSALEKEAKDKGFAHIFHGDPRIGGRYSVLSKFGLVPMAAMGLDVGRLLSETVRMMESCAALVPPAANPGVQLGVALGVLARDCGRDKVTIVCSDEMASVGAWLEQLIAESTGKNGKGLIPVDREAVGTPSVYGKDRVFVHLHLVGCDDGAQMLSEFEEAGFPVIRIAIEDSYQLGQLFYAFEFATAVAGAVLGVNPFDQPDVEAAKVKARAVAKQIVQTGKLQQPEPLLREGGIALYADAGLPKVATLAEALKAHLARAKAGDYVALLAFLERSEAHEDLLNALRVKLRDATQLATSVGFGPRFLHSTGQAFKGGPDTGVFFVLTGDARADVAIPNSKLTFGQIALAQAMGDFEVLTERKRRAVRLHFSDIEQGLKTFIAALEQAL